MPCCSRRGSAAKEEMTGTPGVPGVLSSDQFCGCPRLASDQSEPPRINGEELRNIFRRRRMPNSYPCQKQNTFEPPPSHARYAPSGDL